MNISEVLSALLEWLAINAPTTRSGVRSPASDVEVAAAEAETGFRWPDDVKEMYSIADGASSFSDGQDFLGSVAPAGYWYSLAEAMEERAGALRANEIFDRYRREYLPLMGMDGNFLYVNVGEGPDRGYVGTWDDVEGDIESPGWPSATALFMAILRSLEARSEFVHSGAPLVENGILDWEIEPSEDE